MTDAAPATFPNFESSIALQVLIDGLLGPVRELLAQAMAANASIAQSGAGIMAYIEQTHMVAQLQSSGGEYFKKCSRSGASHAHSAAPCMPLRQSAAALQGAPSGLTNATPPLQRHEDLRTRICLYAVAHRKYSEYTFAPSSMLHGPGTEVTDETSA